MQDILVALAAVIIGPVATFALYFVANALVARLPRKVAKSLGPYVFIGPVLVLVGFFLVYPTIATINFSFMNSDSTEYVGFKNFTHLFNDGEFVKTLSNNFLWVLVVPAASLILGLIIATLANNVGPTREKVFKSIIFMPMAISFVAASSIWRLTYSYESQGTQVGLLNAIVTAFGGEPVAWMQVEEGSLNSLLLMVIVIWLNTGFAMTLLSAAIKSVPEESIEAASLDGASKVQTFFQVVLPQIRVTAVSVFITVLIGVMKIFDVIWGMTGGDFHTNVLGVDFMLQYFVFTETGRATAIVVLLMLAIIPIMIYQIRAYRKQEELR
jgi:alpha-glucoside transport system permease protein